MRFICDIDVEQYLLEADSFESAARLAAQTHAGAHGVARDAYRVHVAEANDADFPLYTGEDFIVTLDE